MRLKNFQDLIEKKLTKEQIAEIERKADLEITALKKMQKEVKRAVNDYMKQNDIGFNEMVRRLNSNPTQLSKIQKGEANLTISSLAHLSALLNAEPVLQFKKK